MEGGRIVQCGTPQEIIRDPANDYVADFVAHMNPLGVLCAEDVMEAGTAPDSARAVELDTSVADIMNMFLSNDEPLLVLRDGQPAGVVTPQSFMSGLAGKPAAS
jgi:glycine betaine/proline transport system ATP-binding protein